MVLAIRRRKLGLKKEALARDPLLRKGQQGFSHQSFLVMDQLVGRVDRCEASRHGLLHQLHRGLFFPRRAIHERRNRHMIVGSQRHDVYSKTNKRFSTKAYGREAEWALGNESCGLRPSLRRGTIGGAL